jgi:hypothetical protein
MKAAQTESYRVHVGHTPNIPFADVSVERRPSGITPRNRGEEQFRHACHRCGVPVGDRTVRCRRRHRIGKPRQRGRANVCVVKLRCDVRRQHEEQSEAGEAVRPPCEGPSAQEATRRGAPPCDTLQRGTCCIIVQRRTACITETCRNTRYCGALNVPQHTVLQQACRNTSIQPEDNALMQPFAKDACALVARKLPGQATPPKPRCNILVLPHACCTTVDTDLLHNHCGVRQAVRQAAI